VDICHIVGVVHQPKRLERLLHNLKSRIGGSIFRSILVGSSLSGSCRNKHNKLDCRPHKGPTRSHLESECTARSGFAHLKGQHRHLLVKSLTGLRVMFESARASEILLIGE
jgi:hypothetical protein